MAVQDQALLYDSEQGRFYVAVDARGNPILVEGFVAVAQQLLLMIVVETGEYPLDPNLGTDFQSFIGVGGKQSAYTTFIYKQIEQAVLKLKELQQSFTQLIELEDSELIEELRGVDFIEEPGDPRLLNCIITLLTKDGLNKTLSIPTV